jgi:hypothetical protein
MKMSRVDAIANAVLYEGYMLYPYRPSAIKNQQRFNFGVVAPETKAKSPMSSELSCVKTECLLQGTENSTVDIEVRFLQLVQRDVEVPSRGESRSASVGSGDFQRVERCEVDGRFLSSWQEAIERRIGGGPFVISVLLGKSARKDFVFDAVRETEPIYGQDGELAARFVRHREKVSGNVDLAVIQLDAKLFKLTATVVNTSHFCETGGSNHESANLSSFLSTHKVLRCTGAEFVSLTNPLEGLRDHASACKNSGTWPVLAGEDPGNADVLLSSPIILYDYPEIAPESAGELFDGTEIDEILALRILTMTDEEKREMRSVDDRTRAILERTELLPPEHFMKLHGAMRALAAAGKERS